MIISFEMENWMSYRDPVRFSAIASQEKQHGERLPLVPEHAMRILPISALYGGNASGKSNFVKGLRFLQSLVVPDTGGVGPSPFKLDRKGHERPTKFTLQFLIDSTIYEFHLAMRGGLILSERLTDYRPGKRRRVLYDRNGKEIAFHSSLPDKTRLRVIHEGTRDHQLFLYNAESQRSTSFRPVFSWFADTLTVIDPESRFVSLALILKEGHPFRQPMIDQLRELDTGVVGLKGTEVKLDHMPFSDAIARDLERSKVGPGEMRFNFTFGLLVWKDKDGRLKGLKPECFHLDVDGNKESFSLDDESDGTQRLMHLLPAFIRLGQPREASVFVIDEIDRSLHTLATRALLTRFLNGCSPQSRSQLLFTTHDVLLMDQQLLRRDEMWVSERGADGATSLASFSEFKDVRYDKDLRRSYLQGRLGGIPRISLDESPCPEPDPVASEVGG